MCVPMAHAPYLREKARTLRRERRLTIDELAERLALSRSTIYYWVRDLPIPGSGPGGDFPESARRKGNRAMQRKYRRLREEAYRKGWRSFDELVREQSFRDFVCLYIAEGSKRCRNRVAVCNSDPAIVRLAARWLRRLTHKPPIFSIQYHADQDLPRLRRFWGDALDADPRAIRVQRKSNSAQLASRSWRSEHGVLTVAVDDTLLHARLRAWMDRLRETWQ
jgi:excisionase family DNA binding protein